MSGTEWSKDQNERIVFLGDGIIDTIIISIAFITPTVFCLPRGRGSANTTIITVCGTQYEEIIPNFLPNLQIFPDMESN